MSAGAATTEEPNPPPTRMVWAMVALLTVVSLGLKLHGAFDHPLWGDEIFQRTGALQSRWWNFLTWTHACSYYNMPPLSFALHRAVVDVFQTDSEIAWRLPGVLVAAACVPLVFEFARRFLNVPAALFAAGWCAVDFNLGWNAQTARAYPFLVFFLLGGLAVATGPASRRRLIAAVLWFSAACWSHLYAFIFLTGVVGVLWFARWRLSQESASSSMLRWSATLALAVNAPFFLAFQILGHLHSQTGTAPAAHNWSEAFSVVRWCVGLLTWINWPLANPLVIAAAVGALLWLTFRRRQILAGAVVGGGLLVLASLFYLVRHHDFVEPRYLLGTSLILWFGYAALFHLVWPTRARFLALAAIGLIAAQAWRAWNIESYYGTIAHDRDAARGFVRALAYVQSRYPGAVMRLLPDNASFRGSGERLAAHFAAAAPTTPTGTAPVVWLLAGEESATRRYGDPVDRFVEEQAKVLGFSDAKRSELRAACAHATWTVWGISDGRSDIRHF